MSLIKDQYEVRMAKMVIMTTWPNMTKNIVNIDFVGKYFFSDPVRFNMCKFSTHNSIL